MPYSLKTPFSVYLILGFSFRQSLIYLIVILTPIVARFYNNFAFEVIGSICRCPERLSFLILCMKVNVILKKISTSCQNYLPLVESCWISSPAIYLPILWSFTLSWEENNRSVAENIASCPLLFSSHKVHLLTWIHFEVLQFNLKLKTPVFFQSSRMVNRDPFNMSVLSFTVSASINIIICIY